MAAHYLALADALEVEVRGLQPGARMPSEHQLCSANGVSRVTARSALQELERRHLVRRTRGSGTYAAHRIPYPIRPGTTPSWSAIVTDAGHTPGYEVLDISLQPASEPTAHALRIDPATPVMRIARIGTIDGQPAAYHLMHFSTAAITADPATVRSLLEANQSTTKLLADEFDIAIERSATRADLRPIDIDRAETLDLVGRPMAWRTETINRSSDDHRPVEHSEAWLRADSFQVYMELSSSDGASPFAPQPDERTS